MKLLKLLPVCAACCGGAVLAPAAEPFHWGVIGHPLSQEAYWQVPLATQLDLVAESGATWYRFDLSAQAFHANTARVDALLAGAEQRKLQLLPVLFAEPGARNAQATPEQIRSMVEETAQSYEQPEEIIRWYYAQPQRLGEVEGVAIENNVVAWVLGKAKVTDKAAVFDELMGQKN